MSETSSQPPAEWTFAETAFSRASQLLADPITDSTRKRQSLLLLLSVLSLAVFFGIFVPEKASLGGFDVKIATPLTPSGAPSTTPASIARSALAFNRVLCPVLIYSILAFWLSLYRDHEAAKYLRALGISEVTRAAIQEYAAVQAKRKEQLSVLERYQSSIAKHKEESELFKRRIDEITGEFARKCGPIREEHAAAFAEFEKLRKENAPISPELKNKLMALGAQMQALARKQDEDLKPLVEEFPALRQDPAFAELDKQIDEITDESFRVTRKLHSDVSIIAERNAHLWL